MKPVNELLDQANAVIEQLSITEAMSSHETEIEVVFVDLRDETELKQQGTIPGDVHCSRSLLEFKIDPTSPDALHLRHRWHRKWAYLTSVTLQNELKGFLSPSQIVVHAATEGMANFTNCFNNALGIKLP